MRGYAAVVRTSRRPVATRVFRMWSRMSEPLGTKHGVEQVAEQADRDSKRCEGVPSHAMPRSPNAWLWNKKVPWEENLSATRDRNRGGTGHARRKSGRSGRVARKGRVATSIRP